MRPGRGDAGAARRGRRSWAASRGRSIYNMVLLGAIAVIGLILVFAPQVLGVKPEARPYGAVLAGYALVRAYLIYRRFRAQPPRRPGS